MIQRLTRARGILHNRRPASLSRVVRSGDVVAVRIAATEEPSLPPVPMDLSIVYEDPDLLVIDKPAGLLVHPTSPSHRRTLAHGIAHHLASIGTSAKVRPIHRLDKETTGLVIVAKSAYAHQHLDRQLRQRELTREYLALVQGTIAEDDGVVDAPIGRMPRKPQLRRVSAGGQPARTHYQVRERLDRCTLLRVTLETGRTHQIRVHFGHLGHPLVGDSEYGADDSVALGRYALHSWRLTFNQPRSNERISLEAPVPADLHQLLEEERRRV